MHLHLPAIGCVSLENPDQFASVPLCISEPGMVWLITPHPNSALEQLAGMWAVGGQEVTEGEETMVESVCTCVRVCVVGGTGEVEEG